MSFATSCKPGDEDLGLRGRDDRLLVGAGEVRDRVAHVPPLGGVAASRSPASTIRAGLPARRAGRRAGAQVGRDRGLLGVGVNTR
jgi:hypothetical protein